MGLSQRVRDEFEAESLDLLSNLESILLDTNLEDMDKEALNSIFRVAHTIKGSAGMFGIISLQAFVHNVETLMDQIRNFIVVYDDECRTLFLDAKDIMQEYIEAFVKNDSTTFVQELLERSDSLAEKIQNKMSIKNISSNSFLSQDDENKEDENNALSTWYISLKFHKDHLIHGLDPKSFISFLSKQGEIQELYTDVSSVPMIELIEEKNLYLSFDIKFQTEISKEKIEEIFEFAKDGSSILVVSFDCTKEEFEELYKQRVAQWDSLKGFLTQIGFYDTQKEHYLMEQHIVEAKKIVDIPNRRKDDGSSFLRVESKKVDQLINLIGELVIANSNALQETKSAQANESVVIMSRLVEDIREATMKMRMLPLGESFSKYKRIVHDMAKELDKSVEFHILGGENELDKSIIDKINEPLVHMIRNAIDHGLESTQERVSKGKNKAGNILLNAYHDAGNIVIQIYDDGRGLNKEKIYQKCVQKGLLEEGEHSDEVIYSKIFEAGFSTATQVTNISGRGVGMDVVKRTIEELKGIIDIKTIENEGTIVSIRLPLTLAIIDGFLVKAGYSYYVLPMDLVLECIELNSDFEEQITQNNFINLRGSLLPLLDIRDYFHEEKSENNRENIVVVSFFDKKIGLVVDELLGKFQTVIKPLSRYFKEYKGVSGSTMLGGGEVAMILDIPVLGQYVSKKIK